MSIEVWSGVIGARIGFGSRWLTQQSNIKNEAAREARKRASERINESKQRAFQFVSHIVTATEAMSYITYRANQGNVSSAQINEYKRNIVAMRVQCQSELIGLAATMPSFGEMTKAIWEKLEEIADEIDTAIANDEKSGDKTYPQLGQIFVDTKADFVAPLTSALTKFLSAQSA